MQTTESDLNIRDDPKKTQDATAQLWIPQVTTDFILASVGRLGQTKNGLLPLYSPFKYSRSSLNSSIHE